MTPRNLEVMRFILGTPDGPVSLITLGLQCQTASILLPEAHQERTKLPELDFTSHQSHMFEEFEGKKHLDEACLGPMSDLVSALSLGCLLSLPSIEFACMELASELSDMYPASA